MIDCRKENRNKMSNEKILLSIVMPCLNEAETLGACITHAQKFLAQSGVNGEIIISDNGSDDGSLAIAAEYGVRIVAVREKGYGHALLHGMRAARGDYLIIGDADGSYDFSSLKGFLEAFTDGADLVMGCRLPSGKGTIVKSAMPFLHRYVGNPLLSGLGRILFRVPVNDFHCGLRGLTKSAFEKMQLKSGGMEFASEVVIKAGLLALNIVEIPIIFYPDGRSRKPHLKSFKDGWRHFRLLFLYCPKILFLYPGIIFCMFGLMGLLVMLGLSDLHIFDIVLSINAVLVFSLAFLSGSQLIFYSIIAVLLLEHSGLSPRLPQYKPKKYMYDNRFFYLIGLMIFVVGLLLLLGHVLTWVGGGFTIDIRIYHHFIKHMIVYITLVLQGLQVLIAGFIVDMLKLVNIK